MIDLATIKARCEAATPGPWSFSNPTVPTTFGDRPAPRIDDSSGKPVLVEGADYDDYGYFPDDATWEFIAHAREDLPALAAEVERLRTGIQELSDLHSEGIVRDELICLLYDTEAADHG